MPAGSLWIPAELNHLIKGRDRVEYVRSLGRINKDTLRDVGRPGLDDWQIVVLAAVRLGCNYDYDKLQDQAENHRALRTMLGVGQWNDDTSFSARRIRDTLCQLQPATIAAINQAIVSSRAGTSW